MSAPRASYGLLLSMLSLVVVAVLGVLIGSASIPVGDVLGILAKALGFSIEPTWRPWAESVVLDIRLPRVVTGVCVGAALGLSGASLQGLFRNPLASPSVIGVSSGASLGAVLAIYFGLGALFVWSIPLFAFIGAGVTTFTVYAIATHRGQTPTGSLLLAGVAMSALNVAMSSFLLASAMSSWEAGRMILFWTMGGLEARTWDHVLLVAPIVLLGAALILSYARDLDALLLGEVHAASVGVDVPQVRKLLICATALITGAAVAVSGGIGFVGLVVPHILRIGFGPQHRWLLPASMCAGAAFLVAGDLAVRVLFEGKLIPLGVATASIGAPFFLYLLIRHRGELRI
ncbi:MAG: iron ABC transporter permease [Deltaproteobacteria bacterium]|nr:iron ABC transporter permease [Deltaproteobacteria bacterium]MBW2418204.1 iron ABC transporter permease [Deltaproteobacteria bacterium]